jgi:hypothetical protein
MWKYISYGAAGDEENPYWESAGGTTPEQNEDNFATPRDE